MNDYFSQLPPDLAEEAIAAERKKAIAMMLMKQFAGGVPPQPQGRILGKTSPLAMLANVGAQGLTQHQMGEADSQLSGIRRRGEEGLQQGISSISGAADPTSAIAQALASNDPRVRAYAQAARKTQQELAEKQRLDELERAKLAETARGHEDANLRAVAQAYIDRGDPATAQQILATRQIPKDYVAKPVPKPSLITETGANGKPEAAWQEVDPKTGKLTVKPVHGPLVDLKMPGKEGEFELERASKELTTRQEAAKKAQAALASSQQVRNLLRDGAQAGGFTTPLQVARKFASLFGVNVPETGFTDELKSALSKRMVSDVNLLGRQPTDKDAEIMQSIVGSIDTDPRALVRLSAFLESSAIKDIHDFSTFVDLKRQNNSNPNKNLYDTADVGVNRDFTVSGTIQYKIEVARALAQNGMAPKDISRYTGIKEEDLPPPDAATGFDLAKTLGVGAGKLADKPQPVPRKPISQMSRAEKEAYLRELEGK